MDIINGKLRDLETLQVSIKQNNKKKAELKQQVYDEMKKMNLKEHEYGGKMYKLKEKLNF